MTVTLAYCVTLAKTLFSRITAHMELQIIPLEEFGGRRWADQQKILQALNVEAHRQAHEQEEETVSQQLISSSSVATLVEQLLIFEIWLGEIFPHMRARLEKEVNTVEAYTLLYQGAILANLLEVVLYNEGALESIVDDLMLELCDWCHKQVVALASWRDDARSTANFVEGRGTDLEAQKREIRFGMTMSGLNICRLIVDKLSALPLGVTTRVCSTHDNLMSLLAILSRKPWQRSRGGQKQYFVAGAWQNMAEHTIGQHEAQVWLLLHNLICQPACQEQCRLQESDRLDRILRLRKWITPALTNHLPFLKGLAFVLDQLPTRRDGILEPILVCSRRAGLLAGKDPASIADSQIQGILKDSSDALCRDHAVSLIEAFELDEAVQQKAKDNDDSSSRVLIIVWRALAEDLFQPWLDFSADLDNKKPSESVCITGDDDDNIEGQRWRLKIIDGSILPANSRLSVSHCQLCCEAIVQLPAAPTKAGLEALPPAIWLSIGQLAFSGLVLQLKLSRGRKEPIRDKSSGMWDAYSPVAGAITSRKP